MTYLRGYLAMLLFELTAQRFVQTILLVTQCVLGGGAALIYGFYLGELASGDYGTVIAAGLPALALIPLGFIGPAVIVGYRRANGSHDFFWSLPVPRTASIAATLTIFTLLALPGTALVLGIAIWRYDPAFALSPSLVTAVLLSALMSASLGYAIAQGLPAKLTGLLNSLVILTVFLFVPIVVPFDRLPAGLALLDQWLPFRHMAVVIRDGLVPGVEGVGRAYLTLAIWTLASWLVTALIVGKRR
jgi:ABC-2 type transport system permease protein